MTLCVRSINHSNRLTHRVEYLLFHFKSWERKEDTLCHYFYSYRVSLLWESIDVSLTYIKYGKSYLFNACDALCILQNVTCKHHPQTVYERFCLPRIWSLRCDYVNGSLSKNPCMYISQISYALNGTSCILNTKNDNYWFHQNYVCLLINETDWVVSLHNIFCQFFKLPSRFSLM